MPDRSFYLKRAQELCSDFSSGALPSTLSAYFHPSSSLAFEHGPPDIPSLPFLGRPFTGSKGIEKYFETITSYLGVKGEMTFSDWAVDTEAGLEEAGKGAVVTCRGRAEFDYKSTGKSWKEQFAYRLELGEDGLLRKYEVWADPLSAYLAAQG